MCLKEFCCLSTPSVEGEGSMDQHPQRDSSPKLKPTKSYDPPKKTLGVNDSDVKGPAATSPLKGNSDGGLKPYTPPKETLPKGGVPKNSSANVTDTTEVQQPPTKIEHESIAPTGDFTGQTRSSTHLYTEEMN